MNKISACRKILTNSLSLVLLDQGRIKPRKFKTFISVLNETPALNNNQVPLAFLHPGDNASVTYRGTVVASLGVQDVKLYSMFDVIDRHVDEHLFSILECSS